MRVTDNVCVDNVNVSLSNRAHQKRDIVEHIVNVIIIHVIDTMENSVEVYAPNLSISSIKFKTNTFLIFFSTYGIYM